MRDPSRIVHCQLDFLCRNTDKGVEHDVSLMVNFRVSSDKLTLFPAEITVLYGNDSVLSVNEKEVEVRVKEDLFTEVEEQLRKNPDYSDFFEKFSVVNRTEGFLVFKTNPSLWNPSLWADLGTNLVLGLLRILLPVPASMSSIGDEGIGNVGLLIPPVGWVPLVFRVRSASRKSIKSFESPYVSSVATFHDLLAALGHIVMLKHPDMKALREPKTVRAAERLDIRASNLAPVLFSLKSKGRLSRIEKALTELFPEVKLEPQLQHGRVALTIKEGDVRHPPPNIADGILKVLAILAAVELGPSLLLIDELENSLHARLIEYVVDVLNSLGVPVLVATHSPAVVDLVGPERTIVVERGEGGGTRVSRIKDPEGLSRKLRELGVTFSDYVMYRATWWGEGDEAPSG